MSITSLCTITNFARAIHCLLYDRSFDESLFGFCCRPAEGNRYFVTQLMQQICADL